jgi:hypothetical protein
MGHAGNVRDLWRAVAARLRQGIVAAVAIGMQPALEILEVPAWSLALAVREYR